MIQKLEIFVLINNHTYTLSFKSLCTQIILGPYMG